MMWVSGVMLSNVNGVAIKPRTQPYEHDAGGCAQAACTQCPDRPDGGLLAPGLSKCRRAPASERILLPE